MKRGYFERPAESWRRVTVRAHVIIIVAAFFGAAAVGLGAFGAHALATTLDARALAIWHTAVDYQFWHTLALLAVGVLARDHASRAITVAATAFIVGISLFSTSLYALALGAPRWIGVVTPLGGVALMLGWFMLAWSASCEHRLR